MMTRERTADMAGTLNGSRRGVPVRATTARSTSAVSPTAMPRLFASSTLPTP
jgi:hypothetical protein